MSPVLHFQSDGHKSPEVITKFPCSLGRGSECTVFVQASDISRFHAAILFEKETYFLQDTHSRNGTFLNGTKVEDREKLNDGDIITLGKTFNIKFFLENERPSSPGTIISKGQKTAPLHDQKSLEILLKVSRILNSSLDYTEVLRRVIDAVIELTRVERGFLIMRQDDGSQKVVIARNSEKEPLADHEMRVSSSVVQQVFDSQESLVTYYPLDNMQLTPSESIHALCLQTVLGVPLKVYSSSTDGREQTKVIGLIYADSTRVAPAEGQQILEILSVLADHAAIAIENARLHQELLIKERMDQDLKIARDIQQSLYPQKFPQKFGIEFAGYTLPLKMVGGDYYDFLELPDGRIALAIGDVTGKGLPAALIMTALQSSLAALSQQFLGVAETVKALNQISARKTALNRFVTFVLAVFDADKRMSFTNAGHNQPLLINSRGEIRELYTGGMILGEIGRAHV